MILLFDMYHKGIKTTAEVRTVERDGPMYLKIMTESGWKLHSVITRGDMWTNEQMRMQCIHSSVCEDSCCIGCDDFEM